LLAAKNRLHGWREGCSRVLLENITIPTCAKGAANHIIVGI
jgi:hypothetical protein